MLLRPEMRCPEIPEGGPVGEGGDCIAVCSPGGYVHGSGRAGVREENQGESVAEETLQCR